MRPLEKLEGSLTKENLWFYILTILKDKPRYAYQIRDVIKKRYKFSPGKVTAYVVLKRLAVEGYVKETRTEKILGPERKYFGITKKGEKELREAKKLFVKLGRLSKK